VQLFINDIFSLPLYSLPDAVFLYGVFQAAAFVSSSIFIARQHTDALTRDNDIANLSVRPLRSGTK